LHQRAIIMKIAVVKIQWSREVGDEYEGIGAA
jgi:hypothetical protein